MRLPPYSLVLLSFAVGCSLLAVSGSIPLEEADAERSESAPTKLDEQINAKITDVATRILAQIIGLNIEDPGADHEVRVGELDTKTASDEQDDEVSDDDDEEESADTVEQESLYEVASTLNVKKFLELSEKVYLQPLLAGKGPYTLFAPTDDAFANLTSTLYEKISKNPEAIEELIINHMVKGNFTVQRLTGRRKTRVMRLKTIGGKDVKFRVERRTGKYYANDIEVEECDITGVNGVIHTIKGFLYLPEIALAKDKVNETDRRVVAPDVVGIVDWSGIAGKQGVTFPSPRPGDSYDGYGPSSINPNDYMPPEEGHVIAVHEMVKKWQEVSRAEAEAAAAATEKTKQVKSAD